MLPMIRDCTRIIWSRSGGGGGEEVLKSNGGPTKVKLWCTVGGLDINFFKDKGGGTSYIDV